MSPKISILMPARDCSETLPIALCSLIYQDYPNWECLLVDDGSKEDLKSIVDQLADNRIRYFRFDHPRGRGAARQFALIQAKGELIGMLDGDDWLYPDRFSQINRAFAENGKTNIISTGMVIVSPKNRDPFLQWPKMQISVSYKPIRDIHVPLAYGPTFFRSAIAKSVSYDASLESCEDYDYLVKLLMDHESLVIPGATYVYRQPESIPIIVLLERLKNNRKVYQKHFRSFPLSCARAWCVSHLKGLGYLSLYLLRANYRKLRRLSPISVKSFEQFNENRTQLDRVVDRLMGTSNLMVS